MRAEAVENRHTIVTIVYNAMHMHTESCNNILHIHKINMYTYTYMHLCIRCTCVWDVMCLYMIMCSVGRAE